MERSECFATLEPSKRLLRNLCLVVWLSLVAWPRLASAEGREFTLNANDLSLKVDTRWAGCAYGGYYPIRIRVVNRGPSANLTFRFEPAASRGSSLPSVERSIGAEQNATVNITLSIPMVGQGENGVLHVLHEGEEVEALRISVALPGPARIGESRPSVLAIANSPVNFTPLEAADNAVLANQVETPAGSFRGGPSRMMMTFGSRQGTVNLSHEVASPSMLPDKWIDYTGLDMVTVELGTLEKINPESRRAIVEWVETGGTLLIYKVGQSAAGSEKLKQLLELDARAAVSADWEPADVQLRERFVTSNILDPVTGNPQVIGGTSDGVWPNSPDTFVRRRLIQGQVYAFKDDLFTGTDADWGWFLLNHGQKELHWPTKNGVSPRGTNDDFLHFMVPGVTGVPTTAFLILITLFTAIIGPVNYFYMLRRKQQYLLLITIPACAFLTSLTLFGYSAVAHGFHVKSRARSLTIVDQKNRTAVTTSRIALFAGLAPSHGLQFSEATAVYPLWPYSENFESGHVDWTQAQSLASGWLRSRTQTQFVTTSRRIERGRLEVEPVSEKMLRVSNGFEWDFDALVVADDKGMLHSLRELPAGAVGETTFATSERLEEVSQLLRRHPLEPPESSRNDRGESAEIFDTPWNWSPERAFHVVADTSRGSMEQQIQELARQPLVLKPRSYLAVLKQNPGVQLGVEKTDARADYHILVGYY